jgi:hypothetical protein
MTEILHPDTHPTMNAVSTMFTAATALCLLPMAVAQPGPPGPVDIKSYCLDFNWAPRGGFAEPGAWKGADPAATVEWHKKVGSNVIQTFAVSCNGYAWYKNGVVPEQPGLKHDFLREVVKLGHAEGMQVMGYFCIAANTRWGEENPELSYGTPSTYHIPYTDEYLAYLSSAITDAVKTTGIDGFMIDWVWMPKRQSTKGKWIEAEKKLYGQLMGEPFPGEDKLSKQQDLEYSRKAIDRCWKAIHKAAKQANPDCIIWLTTNKMMHPHVVDSDMYKQVDWLMGEKGNLKAILQAKPMICNHTHLITCMAMWNCADPTTAVPEALAAGVGLYGFAKPTGGNGTINLDRILPKQLSELSGDPKSIAVLARAYRGKSIDSVWDGKTFVEADPPPFRIEFRGRRGWSDTAHLSHEADTSTITIRNPYQSGRGVMTRTGDQWPETIVIRLLRRNAETPGPTHFRIANGKLGLWVSQKDGLKAVAAPFEGGLDLRKAWYAGKFLNGGQPENPVAFGALPTCTTDEFVEIELPELITRGSPETLAFEWCNGENIR